MKPEIIKICLAGVSDLEEILNLQKLAYIQEAEIYNNYKITPLTQKLDALIGEFKTQTILKAELEGEIIGSIRAYQERDTVYIAKLIVHPKAQNKGLGGQLMLNIESRFPLAARFELFTAYKSMKNLHLYHKLGYREFKRASLASNPDMVFLEKMA